MPLSCTSWVSAQQESDASERTRRECMCWSVWVAPPHGTALRHYHRVRRPAGDMTAPTLCHMMLFAAATPPSQPLAYNQSN
eukprot:2719416-Rhodomonas_salina.2